VAFAVKPATVRRWEARLAGAGVAGLLAEPMGPKRKSKLTADTVAAVTWLRAQGATYDVIAADTGVSVGSVRNALLLAEAGAGAGAGAEETCLATTSDTQPDPRPEPEVGVELEPAPDPAPEPEPDAEPEPEVEMSAEPESAEPEMSAEPEVSAERDCSAVFPAEPRGSAPVPVLADPVPRDAERVWARFGLIESAPPVFTPCARAPLAGMLLALPGLAATGLLECAHEVYGELPAGFYSMDAMLCEAVFRALLGHVRAEGSTRVDPIALGRVLGLDRAPEVKTIRRKINWLAAAGRAGDWIAAMAARHLAARPEQAAVLYVDGHVRAYQGTRKIAKTHVPRVKFPAPATVETWVADAGGDPLLVVLAEPAASLAGELRRLIPELRALVGDGRRVLVGFDRGGWSPALFADLDAAGFDTLTWRKGAAPEVAEHEFIEHSYVDEHGRSHAGCLADTEIELEITDGPRKGEVFVMRQVSLYDRAGTRQMHILTTRRDLPAGEVRYRMGSRWRQENHYRFARMHFDLDSHDSYRASDDDPDRMVPNPAKKPAYQRVDNARHALAVAEIARDTALLDARSPQPGTSVLITNAMLDTINADVHAAEAALDTAIAAHKAVPARLPLAQVHPGQQVLDTETKLVHHAIRIAAYNTARSLARTVATATGYRRADDEAHTLIDTAFKTSGDIVPDPATATLHVRLDRLPAPRHTAALAELCQALNDTHTVYPGTDLTLHYSTKPHPGIRPHIHS
jgi:prepilin-type processing-associated H-X9-DG protein